MHTLFRTPRLVVLKALFLVAASWAAADTFTTNVNQRVNGGTWVALGTFNFSAGVSEYVELSNIGADGFVVADAVRLVGNGVTNIIDDADGGSVELYDAWQSSSATAGYYGTGYLHDQDTRGNPLKWVRFFPDMAQAGAYTVYLRWTANANRASNAQVTIVHNITPEPHTLTVVNGTGSGSYVRRANVVLTADPPAAGTAFVSWRAVPGGAFEDRYASTTHFTMPNYDVTVTADYRTIEPLDPVRESARTLPVAADVDIAVVGSSVGAIGAAVEAARAGAAVMLLCPNGYPGQDVAGENRYWLNPGEVPSSELARELFGTRPTPEGLYYVTPGRFKQQAERALEDNGVDFLYGTYAVDAVVDENGQLAGVVTADKGGRQVVRAKVVVDATPMAGFAQLAGAALAPWPTGGLQRVTRTHYRASVGNDAVILAQYLFAGGSGASTDPDTNSTAGTFTPLSDFGISSSTETAFALGNKTTDSAAGAVAAADGFAFSIAPRPGAALNLTALSFDTAFSRGVSPYPTSTVTATYFVRSSADGFATNIGDAFSEIYQNTTAPTYTTRTVYLGGAAFQGLTTGVTFRIYVYDDDASSGAAARIDNVTLTTGSLVRGEYTEYATDVDMPSGSWEERCRAESRLRWRFDEGDESWSAHYMHMIEPRGIVGEAYDDSIPWVGAGAVDLGVCKPANRDYLYVLGTACSVSRTNAAALARPLELLELGRRLGSVVQAVAAARPRPTGPRVAAAPLGELQAGLDVFESLSGMRPFQQVQRVAETARALPVDGRYDVVVVGGGASGAPAAIGAARAGARVLLIEQLGALGGTGVNGIGRFWRGYRHGFAVEHSSNGWLPNAKSRYYREALESAGGEVWFNTMACGVLKSSNVVHGVVVATPKGRRAVLGRAVIDATGDGDICAWAGADFEFGGGKDGNFALQDAGFSGDVREPTGYQNQTGVYTDPSDIYSATWYRVLCRRYTEHAGKFDHYPLTGLRGSRRITGDCTIRALDEYRGRTYADVIAVATSNWDNHGYHNGRACYAGLFPDGLSFIPYRALLPRGLEGILVVGRCISVERDALALVRMQSDVANEGYAAGVAAAMCVAAGTGLRDVDIAALQDHLRDIGNLPAQAECPCEDMPDPSDLELRTAAADPSVATNMAVLLVDPARSVPFLAAAFASDPTADKARALCFCGATNGVPFLAAWLDTQALTHDGANGRVTPIDSAMRALGYARDARAIPALAAKLAACGTASSDYTHVRAIALSLGDIGCTNAAHALVEFLERPGVTNLVRTVDEGAAAVTGSPGYVAAAQELIVAAALYRCGDTNGVARRVMLAYLDDWRGPLRRFATEVLSYKSTPHGVPYGWFEQHGLGTNDHADAELADTDGDGAPDWQEFWSGTDPRNPDDVLKAVDLTADGRLRWRGRPNALGTPFRIDGSTNLAAPFPWTLSLTTSGTPDGTNVLQLPGSWRAAPELFVRPAATMAD